MRRERTPASAGRGLRAHSLFVFTFMSQGSPRDFFRTGENEIRPVFQNCVHEINAALVLGIVLQQYIHVGDVEVCLSLRSQVCDIHILNIGLLIFAARFSAVGRRPTSKTQFFRIGSPRIFPMMSSPTLIGTRPMIEISDLQKL